MCTDPRESVCALWLCLMITMWGIIANTCEPFPFAAMKSSHEKRARESKGERADSSPPTFLRSLSAASWEVGGQRKEINAIRHRSIVSKSRRHERLPATGIPSDQKASEKVDGIPRIHHLDFLSNQAFYRNHLAMINSLACRCLPSTLWNGIKCSK